MGVTKGGGLYSWTFPLSFQKVIVGYDKNGLGMVLKYQQDTSVEPPPPPTTLIPPLLRKIFCLSTR